MKKIIGLLLLFHWAPVFGMDSGDTSLSSDSSSSSTFQGLIPHIDPRPEDIHTKKRKLAVIGGVSASSIDPTTGLSTLTTLLKLAQRVPEGFICSFQGCGKTIKGKKLSNLTRHLHAHMGEKPYSCPYCEHKFTQSSNMKIHVKKVHADMHGSLSSSSSSLSRLVPPKRGKKAKEASEFLLATSSSEYRDGHRVPLSPGRASLAVPSKAGAGENPWALFPPLAELPASLAASADDTSPMTPALTLAAPTMTDSTTSSAGSNDEYDPALPISPLPDLSASIPTDGAHELVAPQLGLLPSAGAGSSSSSALHVTMAVAGALSHKTASDDALTLPAQKVSGGFICTVEGCKKFIKGRLKHIQAHHRIHTGEKPYGCPYCTYKSVQSSNIKTHIKKMHSGLGSSSGSSSRKMTTSSSAAHGVQMATEAEDKSLRASEEALQQAEEGKADKKVPCMWTGCNKLFGRHGTMQRHVKYFHIKERWHCTQIGCPKSFSQKVGLQRHLNSIHKSSSVLDLVSSDSSTQHRAASVDDSSPDLAHAPLLPSAPFMSNSSSSSSFHSSGVYDPALIRPLLPESPPVSFPSTSVAQNAHQMHSMSFAEASPDAYPLMYGPLARSSSSSSSTSINVNQEEVDAQPAPRSFLADYPDCVVPILNYSSLGGNSSSSFVSSYLPSMPDAVPFLWLALMPDAAL